MKITVKRPVEIEALAIKVILAVRYDDEDMPYDFPKRNGDLWEAVIDIATGCIREWPGVIHNFYMKVCDEGRYFLLGDNDEVLATKDGYVPNCIPGQYGDYVDFKIDKTGKIANWEVFCTENNIAESFADEEWK